MERQDYRVKLATLILEELAVRSRPVKARFLKTYRLTCFWLGPETARYILSKLREGGYIHVDDKGRISLRVNMRTSKNLRKIIEETEKLVKELYSRGQISLR